MHLSSPAFRDGDEIPVRYTCEGADVSPPLAWSDVPPHAKSLALVVEDPDAPDPDHPMRTWVHWVVFDLLPETQSLREDVHRVSHGRLGANDWDRTEWGGPCPPIGRHRYFFRLYALDRVLDLDRPSRVELDRAMAGHIVAEATLLATYQRHKHG